MQKRIHFKHLAAVLLPIIFLVGTVFYILTGQVLKADDSEQAFAKVQLDGKTVSLSDISVKKESVKVTLKGKDTRWVRLPVNQEFNLELIDKEDNRLSIEEKTEEEKQTLIQHEKAETTTFSSTETTNSDSTATEESEEEALSSTCFYVTSEEDSKELFIYLVKDEEITFEFERNSKKKISVTLFDWEDSKQKQELFSFAKVKKETKKQVTKTKESTESKNTKEQKNEEPMTEPQELVNAEEFLKDTPQVVNTKSPLKLTADVGRSTGLAPFDTTDDPGYDSDPANDIVRTFDQVNYRVNLGISTTEDYKTFLVQLDAELDGAWRKDSSGQTRQTAEFVGGTMIDNGDGTKKTTYRSQETATATSQAFFTVNLETFGGVNKDELLTKFKLTVVSGTKANGEVVPINQVLDSSVDPIMDEKTYLSAQPLVDVKVSWNKDRKSTFDKLTSTNDKPNSLVATVGTYVQLKPLPNRVDERSIKGSTYPVGGVKYTLNQKINYTNQTTGVSKDLVIGTETDPIELIAYDGLSGDNMPKRKFTDEYLGYESVYKPLALSGLPAPYGYTQKVYPSNQPFHYKIGIFDTGNPKAKNNTSNHSIEIENDDYISVSVGKNKSLYNGIRMDSQAEPFSVTAMQVLFPYGYLDEHPGKMEYTLSVTEVVYENKLQKVDSQLIVPWVLGEGGTMSVRAVFQDKDKLGLGSAPASVSYGDGSTSLGNSIYSMHALSFKNDIESNSAVLFGRWNANSFTFDNTRKITTSFASSSLKSISYGIGKSIPDISLRNRTELDKEYTWYSDINEALSQGEIVAVKVEANITSLDGAANYSVRVPLKVKGIVGVKDKDGNSNIALSNGFTLKSNLSQSLQGPGASSVDYSPSEYNEKGQLVKTHNPSVSWGDTAYIQPFIIRPTLTTDKKSYTPSENIKWTATGSIESGSEGNHKVQLAVTIPKETQYISGTAVDHEGKPLPDPVIQENPDGTVTLIWIKDYMAENSTYNPTVSFETSIVSSSLDFINNVASLDGKLVTDVWLEEDETVRDTSPESQRTSTAGLTVTNQGVISIDKIVDKPFIEAGNEVDPAKPSIAHPTDFTYTVSYKNHATNPMYKVRLLDPLPYNGDGRTTAFHGSYSVVSASTSDGSGKIYYTNNVVNPDEDPNGIPLSGGWRQLGSDMSVLSKAKAIMVLYDSLEPGKALQFKVTLRPDGQEAGDIYANNTSLNSSLSQHVAGNISKTRVYGRDLSGVAWYDDSYDGLIGNLPSGKPEAFAADIPVKLYRTSLEEKDYKDKLVEASLTGEKFVDASGNSLIKTDANGRYSFKNLPEGTYVAEFIVDGQVVKKEFKVTTPLVGDDPTLNSKADQKNYKTPGYENPLMKEIPTKVTDKDPIYHIKDVNIGLNRPSKINLIKYATGTAIDANKDGVLSDIEKETGTRLAGAEFEIRQGDTVLGKATTNEQGELDFEFLFKGDYTLIETKAPAGYELLKKPITVSVTEGNVTVKVFQEDDKVTQLPYTGGNGPLQLFLLISGSLFVVGMVGVIWYYKVPRKRGVR